MKFCIISIFPELFEPFFKLGIVGRAKSKGLINVEHINPRDFATDAHKTIDDRPYGGGPGMVMMVDPLRCAIQDAKKKYQGMGIDPKVIYLSPSGKPLNQQRVRELANCEKGLIFLAGRYEGIDQRIIENDIDEMISIGDYIISGGECAAMVCIDAITRLLPGALGSNESALQDGFNEEGLLDHPHYTRPREWVDFDTGKKHNVPEVLLSGDHEAILKWRRKMALGHTFLARKDLFEKLSLDKASQELVTEFIEDYQREVCNE